MTMSKGLASYIEGKVSELKVICGLSLDSPAREERAIKSVKPDPIPAVKFMNVYRQRKRSGQLGVEFKALLKNQDEHSTTAALRNVLHNNKQDVLPYDYSRVILMDFYEQNDYYNASYIDGYNVPREYIACQGPSAKSTPAFWHMVWQEGVTCVVMATGLFENAMQQCDKYWVDHASNFAMYGDIKVWHEASTCLAQLNIRTFRLQKEGNCETRFLYQFEMTGLHEECPDSGLLLDVRRRVHALTYQQPGSVLVHCRCGGGRTAVYVALDYCLYQLQAEDRVDVYNTVLHLRRFRKNMVKTAIYHAVAMYIQCGMTVYSADTLPSAYQLHYASVSDGNQKLDREFQTLQSIVPRLSIGDCASGHRVENRSKSRDIMMLPPECARPYLNTADCGDSGTDFINAVYVDGYYTTNRYLVTQWPMKKTMGDVWRLLFDFKITSLVLMNDLDRFSRAFLQFWPKEVDQVLCYGPISVRYIGYERHPDLIIRTFAIRKILNSLVGCEIRRDEYIVKMFQVLGNETRKRHDSSSLNRYNFYNGHHQHRDWRRECDLNDRIVDDADISLGRNRCKFKNVVSVRSKSLLSAMEYVDEWQQRSRSRHPVCVMSKSGSAEVGLYCAISMCCDQLKAEKEVDVFNAVRYVRSNRPQLVPTLEEYRFIYQFMVELIRLSKSKPDIIVSQSSQAFFTTPDKNKEHSIIATIHNSIHGGVYVTRLEGNSTLNHSGRALKSNDAGIPNTLNIPHLMDNNHKERYWRSDSTDKPNLPPFKTISSSSSSLHKPSWSLGPNGIGQSTHCKCTSSHLREYSSSPCYSAPSFTGKISVSSNHIPESVSPSSNETNHGLVLDPNRLHVRYNSDQSNTFTSSNCFLSPNQYTCHSGNILNSNNGLCKSASFHSCNSHFSENHEDEDSTQNIISKSKFYHPHGVNCLYKDEDLLESSEYTNTCELASKTQSCSTFKDSPTDDTSISFPSEHAESHSNKTSCASFEDSLTDIDAGNSAEIFKERNNNCHKDEQNMRPRRILDILKMNRDSRKSRGEKWSFSFHKILGMKKVEQRMKDNKN